MRSCETCKVILEEGAAYCPRCGRPVPVEFAQDAPQMVRNILAQANLHRIRGDYDVAIDNCTEAIRLQPADPEIHSVLGDIYESAGNLDEAARWYQMAVELTPDSALDAAKLERIRARIRKRTKRGRPELVTGTWTRSFLQSRSPDPGIRKIVIVSSACVFILLVFGVLGWVLRPQAQKPESPPVFQQPLVKPTAPTEPAGTAIPPVSNDPSADVVTRPSAEVQIMSSLQINPLVSDRRLVIEDVKQDPRSGSTMVTFRLPEPAIPMTKLEVMRDAAAVAVSSFGADANTTSVCIRVLAGIRNKQGAVEAHLVLICDTYAQIKSIDLKNISPDELSRYFTNVWWGSDIPQ